MKRVRKCEWCVSDDISQISVQYVANYLKYTGFATGKCCDEFVT